MASAWGKSWGAYWGNSWGSVSAVVVPPVVTPAPGGMWGASFHISERDVADMLRLLYPRRKKRKQRLVEPELTAEKLEAAALAVLNDFGPPPADPAPLRQAAMASAAALRTVQANRLGMLDEIERFLRLAALLREQEAERQRIADDEDEIELLLLSAA